jgi:hypothetical protein
MHASVNNPIPMVNRTGFAAVDVISKSPLFLPTSPSKADASGYPPCDERFCGSDEWSIDAE